MNLDFRTLRADEIEIRVGSVHNGGAVLLLYKDARCDMNLLDEVVGPMNWKREHSRDNANCTVSIYDADKKEWVSKEDTGKQSFTEAEKGLASDSFKRACVNWGIGRELYSSPFTWVSCPTQPKNGGKGYELTNKSLFSGSYVSEISYDDNRNIVSLTICNKNNEAIFQFPQGKKNSGKPKPTGNKVSAEDVERIRELANLKGVSLTEITQRAGVKKLEDMVAPQAESCLNWLRGM